GLAPGAAGQRPEQCGGRESRAEQQDPHRCKTYLALRVVATASDHAPRRIAHRRSMREPREVLRRALMLWGLTGCHVVFGTDPVVSETVCGVFGPATPLAFSP